MNLKRIALFFLGILTLSIFLPTTASVYAAENSTTEKSITELNDREFKEYQEELSEELEFYFSKVGYLDENNNYHVTNPELLEEKAKTDESAALLYEQYNTSTEVATTRSAGSFVKCIIGDQFSWAIDMINGNTLNSIANLLKTGAWEAASNILSTALKQVSAAAGKSVSVAFSAASLALSAYSCRNEW
ncbi:hypothetical protein [Aerococcus urinaeequi]|uniref:hypothetical protein n=1 Tax=Aerococcus urinaeequi TaxID=51665 RepID=UPI000845FA2D|nr:hypothetical protein [Aerococcus urinaeequi]